MRRYIPNIILISLIGIFVFSEISHAYWIWTPETKKFVNPKNAVKDTPKEQFEWAMSFYNAKDYQRAAFEFEKLAKQYEFSDYASRSQYYVGLCYENMQKYYIAFENYQKAIDNFPHLSNTDEVLARQYAIGNIYLEKLNPKVVGKDIMAPLDRAVEIFKKVVENAPYGKYAQDAQFKLGEALKRSERYEEAVQAYHKIVEDYPNSKYATKAMYEEADCAYKASLKPAYDAGATDSAIKTFEKFTDKNKDTNLAQEADKTMKRLKDSVAEKSFKAAEFYESQGKKEAAIIYYQDVIDTYPESSFVSKAKAKIEALKNSEKSVYKPFEFDKKKAKPAAQKTVAQEVQKKPWSPLIFSSKKQDSKKTNVVTQEPSKKKPWKALSFFGSKKTAQKKVTEAPVVETPPVQTKKEEPALQPQEAGKEKSWKPLSFETKKESATKETPKKKIWTPFSLGTKKESTPKDAVQKKPWKPLSFFGEKKDKEEPVLQPKEAPKEKGWKPLNFNTKKEESTDKSWKPLYFGTNDEPMEGLR